MSYEHWIFMYIEWSELTPFACHPICIKVAILDCFVTFAGWV